MNKQLGSAGQLKIMKQLFSIFILLSLSTPSFGDFGIFEFTLRSFGSSQERPLESLGGYNWRSSMFSSLGECQEALSKENLRLLKAGFSSSIDGWGYLNYAKQDEYGDHVKIVCVSVHPILAK